jgi:hypothetical protein
MENKFLTIKRLENGKLYIDLHKYLIGFVIIFIMIFPLTYISSRNFIGAFLFTLIFWGLITLIVEISDFIGKKAHQKIMHKKIFKDLLAGDFEVETIGDYNGLITKKNGRTIRVFYNWNKLAEGPFSFGDIDINIAFVPPFSLKDPKKIDESKLKFLTKKYDRTFFSKTKRTLFTYNCLRICFNFYPWTKSTKIEKEIDRGLKILDETGLKPLDLKNIDNERLEELDKHGFFLPNMEHIWEFTDKKSP